MNESENRRKKQSSHPVFPKKGEGSIMLSNRVFANSCRQNHPTFHFWTFIFVHFQNPKHFTNIEIHRKRKSCWFLSLFGIVKYYKTLYPLFFLSFLVSIISSCHFTLPAVCIRQLSSASFLLSEPF